MSQKTAISWTDASSNPLKYRDKATGRDVWACVKHSSGCANCYAESLAGRFGRGGLFTRASLEKVEPYLCEKELNRLLAAKSLAGKRVFVGDMTDVFGDWVPDEFIHTLLAAFAMRPDVTFQVLTKRAERMLRVLGGPGCHLSVTRRMVNFREYADPVGPWPLPNVWAGVSVENQAAADERAPHLLATPAAVRFLSCEPLLGPVNLKSLTGCTRPLEAADCRCFPAGLHWVIVGGESGATVRPMAVEWAASLVSQCRAAGVACFVKQDSGRRPGQQGRLPLEVWQAKKFPGSGG